MMRTLVVTLIVTAAPFTLMHGASATTSVQAPPPVRIVSPSAPVGCNPNELSGSKTVEVHCPAVTNASDEVGDIANLRIAVLVGTTVALVGASKLLKRRWAQEDASR
jgi:hypothetical protein